MSWFREVAEQAKRQLKKWPQRITAVQSLNDAFYLLCQHYHRTEPVQLYPDPSYCHPPCALLQRPTCRIMLTDSSSRVQNTADLLFQTVTVESSLASISESTLQISYTVPNLYRHAQRHHLEKQDNPIAQQVLKAWRKQKHWPSMMQHDNITCNYQCRSAQEISDFVSSHLPI